jgi:hypothetical protein
MAQFNPSKPLSTEEFDRILEAITNQVVEANIYFRLFKDLLKTLDTDEYQDIQLVSRTFWSLTLNAHYYTAIHYLCRVFDQNPLGLHLKSFLTAVEANLHLFSEAEFRKRLKDNVYVDDLASVHRIPDDKQLEEDMRLCSEQNDNDLVKTLMRHRHAYLAHNDGGYVVKQKDIRSQLPLPISDLDVLMARASKIVNRYSTLYKAESHSTQILGYDDYKHVLESISAGRKLKRARKMHLLDEIV